MFYLKDWLENADEKKAFADKNGYELKVPDTWDELDAMMAYFHRPDKGKYGGALFRTQYFIAWEWWVRFHAKGFLPVRRRHERRRSTTRRGVAALEELVAASKYLYPGARSNGLFENFEAYGEGDKFCNIGWGGTQKFLNSDKSKMQGQARLRADAGRRGQRQAAQDALLQLGLELRRVERRRRSRRSPISTRSMPARR